MTFASVLNKKKKNSKQKTTATIIEGLLRLELNVYQGN